MNVWHSLFSNTCNIFMLTVEALVCAIALCSLGSEFSLFIHIDWLSQKDDIHMWCVNFKVCVLIFFSMSCTDQFFSGFSMDSFLVCDHIAQGSNFPLSFLVVCHSFLTGVFNQPCHNIITLFDDIWCYFYELLSEPFFTLKKSAFLVLLLFNIFEDHNAISSMSWIS